MMAKVTSVLTATGITICSCLVGDQWTFNIHFNSIWCIIDVSFDVLIKQAEIDRRKGMGVMLFHYEGTYDDLVIF